MQPVYHEPYGARSPTSREAATLQIAVGRKGKTKDALSKEEENKPFQSMRGKEREEANRKLLLSESCAKAATVQSAAEVAFKQAVASPTDGVKVFQTDSLVW